jgi:hypothetical protein
VASDHVLSGIVFRAKYDRNIPARRDGRGGIEGMPGIPERLFLR